MDIYFRVRRVTLDVGTFRFIEYFFVLDNGFCVLPKRMPSRFESRVMNTFGFGLAK